MQSKFSSFLEALTNTLIGFITAFFIWQYILPLVGVVLKPVDSVKSIMVFNVASVIRGYIVRRFFSKLTDKPKHS